MTFPEKPKLSNTAQSFDAHTSCPHMPLLALYEHAV